MQPWGPGDRAGATQPLRDAMLDEKRITEIAQEVAKANLASTTVTSVSSSPTVDLDGHDALRITIVIEPGAAAKISGDAALDTMAGIKDRLRREGEDRPAIVYYATQEELEPSDDL
jgi:2-methylisocitrate lyase-like PEP mutase family enzyme